MKECSLIKIKRLILKIHQRFWGIYEEAERDISNLAKHYFGKLLMSEAPVY